MNTSDTNEKPALRGPVFFTISVLCLIGAVFGLLQRNFLFSIPFVILQGCLTPIFLLAGRSSPTEPSEESVPERPPVPTGVPLEMMNRDAVLISQLRQEKDDLTYSNEQLTEQIREMIRQNDQLAKVLAETELRRVPDLDPRLAASILPPEEQVVDLDLIPLAQKIVEEMQPDCAKAGIRLELSTSSASLLYQADERYIRMMIRNIIDNSIKYMMQEGTLVITLSNAGSNIFLAFKDTGLGLPAEEMPNIFELNFQGSNRVSGNGLGLAQVKAIVEHYHGTIYANSSNGMGIYVQLPRED